MRIPFIKRSLLGAAVAASVSMAAVSMPAAASLGPGIIVSDPGAIAQAIAQVEQMILTYKQIETQVKQSAQLLEDIGIANLANNVYQLGEVWDIWSELKDTDLSKLDIDNLPTALVGQLTSLMEDGGIKEKCDLLKDETAKQRCERGAVYTAMQELASQQTMNNIRKQQDYLDNLLRRLSLVRTVAELDAVNTEIQANVGAMQLAKNMAEMREKQLKAAEERMKKAQAFAVQQHYWDSSKSKKANQQDGTKTEFESGTGGWQPPGGAFGIQ